MLAPVVAEVIGAVVLGGTVGLMVALAAVGVLGGLLQRNRARADAQLDQVSSQVLQMAVRLSEQTRAEGHDARLRLIRAAHMAMSEAQASGRRAR